jgi:two-component system sensor kinase FixL
MQKGTIAMVQEASSPASAGVPVLPVITALLAIGIFAFDTFSTYGMAAAVLYSVVVLLSVKFLQRRGILLVSVGCAALAIFSYVLAHSQDPDPDPFARLLVSLLAIGVTAFLALKNRSDAAVLYGQAQLLDLTHDTIFVRDMNNCITYWNHGAELLYGWTRGEALGKATHKLMQTVFPAPLEEINADLHRSGHWEGELVHTKRDGQHRVVASRWSLQRDDRGRPVAILETNNDITARKQAEEKILEAQAELSHITRVTTLGEFSATIAHEVNQPLAAIVTNGQICLRLLEQDPLDLAEMRDAIHAIVGDGRRASEIIQRIRGLARKTRPEKVALDINDVINEVIPLVHREMLSHRVSLRLELASMLPPVRGDRVQLQQVIINLAVNGMEAMAPVTDRPRELIIRSQQDDSSQVLVAVKDSGIGIDPEHLNQLFKAFFTTKPSGMGMGLSICRTIIENHGGTLSALPNAGPGATLQFTLRSLQEATS